MEKYAKILYWSDRDQCYIIETPELPGCIADGATVAEALKNSDKIVSEWIETARSLGREIPVPKGRPALRVGPS